MRSALLSARAAGFNWLPLHSFPHGSLAYPSRSPRIPHVSPTHSSRISHVSPTYLARISRTYLARISLFCVRCRHRPTSSSAAQWPPATTAKALPPHCAHPTQAYAISASATGGDGGGGGGGTLPKLQALLPEQGRIALHREARQLVRTGALLPLAQTRPSHQLGQTRPSHQLLSPQEGRSGGPRRCLCLT